MGKKEDDEKEYSCMKIRCKDKKMIPFLYKKMKATKHFENILLILIDQDFKQNNSKNFNLLTNGDVMRAVLRNNVGGKKAEKVRYLQEFYKNNELMKSLKEVSKELKIHNLTEQIKDIKKNYNSFFTKIKNGDTKAKPPKPRKLSKISNATIFTDGYKAFSYKMRRKNDKGRKIGINLDTSMKYTYLPHKHIEKVVGKMENIANVNIGYSNGNFYYLINYKKPAVELNENLKEKWAGIDPGIANLLSIYIDDDNSKSLIIDGARYIDYNTKSNRFIGKINSEISYNKNMDKKYTEGLSIDKEIAKLVRYRKFLYEKRNNYFEAEFNKLSVRVLEYLSYNGVTHVAIPTNLSYLKNNGNNKMDSENMQKFMQIPFMQLVKNIINKACKYNITPIVVDEAYTSKTSCISSDIVDVQRAFQNHPKLAKIIKNDKTLSANVFKGTRAKRSKKEVKGHRGMFFDYDKKMFINSDLNGAANICKLGKGSSLIKIHSHKLCNPIKVKCDGELLGQLRNSLRIEKVA